MTEKQIELVRQMMRDDIYEEEFWRDFGEDIINNEEYIVNLLEVAYDEKNCDDIEYLMEISFGFDIITEKYFGILCKLMTEPWHNQHENFAGIFQDFRYEKSVECLYEAAVTEFEYLNYDDNYVLAVKCIWALAYINTDEAREKLKLLAQSNNEIIRENALKQLSRNRI